MLGVKTIGNATLIAFDGKPILSTDPWFGDEDEAYFGSWRLSHEIPTDIKQEILRAEYVWFSHGHPDHLNPHSKQRISGQIVLLPDHVGGRIARDLKEQGYNVKVLPDRKWVQLSPRIRTLCIPDYNQDAILLVDVNGRLFVNMNDASPRGSLRLVRSIVENYADSYLLKLAGFGDADMINFFDESGRRIERIPDRNVGESLSGQASIVGAKKVIPFSAFHKYQRADSIWANRHTTPLEAFEYGFNHDHVDLLPAFVFVNCDTGEVIPIDPAPLPERILEPGEFGDDWADPLDADDKAMITRYFSQKERLNKFYGFLRFRVGGQDHLVELKGPKTKGITFECPRNSLMTGVRYEIFDDLLIGNFMKTTLHGVRSLYDPDFTGVVAKYADQAGAQTEEQLRDYFREYKRRAGLDLMRHLIERDAVNLVRRYVSPGTPAWTFGKRTYFLLKRAREASAAQARAKIQEDET